MSDPYRDRESMICPACREALRPFGARLCCDSCNGMFISVEDLTREIISMGKLEPAIRFDHEHPGKRRCPRCTEPMTESRLCVELTGLHPKIKPTLDRCTRHGLWFDTTELATVLEAILRSIDFVPGVHDH
jgi:hypothetical protein